MKPWAPDSCRHTNIWFCRLVQHLVECYKSFRKTPGKSSSHFMKTLYLLYLKSWVMTVDNTVLSNLWQEMMTSNSRNSISFLFLKSCRTTPPTGRSGLSAHTCAHHSITHTFTETTFPKTLSIHSPSRSSCMHTGLKPHEGHWMMIQLLLGKLFL